MKIKALILFLMALTTPIMEFAQSDNNDEIFKKNFSTVADAFEKNVKPYLLKFSTNQFNIDKNAPGYKNFIDSYYRIYVQKAEQLRSDGYEELHSSILNQKKNITKAYLIEYFTFAYRIQFPGLDYTFFEACEKELK